MRLPFLRRDAAVMSDITAFLVAVIVVVAATLAMVSLALGAVWVMAVVLPEIPVLIARLIQWGGQNLGEWM